jgi:hypothetical protein
MSFTIHNHEHPRLLIPWERRGTAFLDALGPALSRSPRRLDTESGSSGVPARALFASSLFHVALVVIAAALAAIDLPALPSLTSLPPDPRVYTLTYLPSLSPEVADSSGSEEGRSGAAGGTTAYHPVQVIRIARGAAQVAMVYQPPKLALPRASSGFMNLLVVPPLPVVPLPEVPDVALHSRAVPPVPVDVPPPPPRIDSIASTRAQLTLPEPVSPPPTINGVSARVQQIPVEITAPPSPNTAPPLPVAALGATPDAGFLISATPGHIAGAPPEAHPGTLAMAPYGTGSIGAGGSGLGSGTGKGTGPGSEALGSGPGSGKAGSGYGRDKLAHGGTADSAGSGGTGSGANSSAMGVTIRGGPPAQPGVIYLSSFAGPPPQPSGGSPLDVSSNPQAPLGPRRKPAITIVASPRAGGGMAAYGTLSGARVYTTYLDTAAGLFVLQYSDPASNEPGYDGDLVAPDPLNLSLPQDLPMARIIVACTIDRNGVLKAFRVLETSDANVATRILAALAAWRFRPVLRRDTPIEVSAILGFHVGTQ